MTWERVCSLDRLPPGDGVPAVLGGERVIAVFRTADDELFAVGNIDPFSDAPVMSRGIVGDRDGEPTVTSPMLMQVFSLRTGVCLDHPGTGLPVYPIRLRDGTVEVGAASN